MLKNTRSWLCVPLEVSTVKYAEQRVGDYNPPTHQKQDHIAMSDIWPGCLLTSVFRLLRIAHDEYRPGSGLAEKVMHDIEA